MQLLVNAGVFREPTMPVYYLGQMFILGVQVNLILAMFNLLPLPPLDGSGIITGLLPLEAAMRYQELKRYGFALLLALMFLPQFVHGFPDIIGMLAVWPARELMNLFCRPCKDAGHGSRRKIRDFRRTAGSAPTPHPQKRG
ncbi:hypothetical protein DFAR_1920004 [Desulfarculales bacterium]